MNCFKTTIKLIIAASIFAAGCSGENNKSTGHEGHQNMDHSSHSMPQQEIQVFENGRIIEFNMDAPAINLTDQDGRAVTNESIRGKVALVNFIYTNCDESCPVMVHKFNDIAAAMSEHLGKDLLLLSITMDPERDDVAAMKTYAEKIKAEPSYWSLLTGDKGTIEKTLKDFSFFYQKNEDGSFGHGNSIMLIDRNGKWRYNFNVLTVPVDIALERIKKEF